MVIFVLLNKESAIVHQTAFYTAQAARSYKKDFSYLKDYIILPVVMANYVEHYTLEF